MAASAGDRPVRLERADRRHRARVALSELGRDLTGTTLPAPPGPPPKQLTRLFRNRVADLATRIGERVQHEVAAYAGPSDGGRRRLIELATTGAIGELLGMVEDPRAGGRGVDELFRRMGYGEAAEGHDLAAMRAALSVAGRESWDELRVFAADYHLPAAALGRLGVGLFAHLDCLAEEVRLGYEGALRAMGRRQDVVRRRLAEALLAGAPREEIDPMAAHVSWTVPESVVVLAVEHEPREDLEEDLEEGPEKGPEKGHATGHATEHETGHETGLPEIAGLPDSTLVTTVLDQPYQPDRPGRVVVICAAGDADSATAALRSAFDEPVAMSWPVALTDVPEALGWATRAFDLVRRGVIPDTPVIDCAQHQTQIWLHAEPLLRQRLCQQLLRPLLAETPNSRKILSETLLAWLGSRDSARAIAGRLGVHPQTVRYRWKRINDLFGEDLQDPEFIVQITMLLQASVPLWNAGDQSDFELLEDR